MKDSGREGERKEEYEDRESVSVFHASQVCCVLTGNKQRIYSSSSKNGPQLPSVSPTSNHTNLELVSTGELLSEISLLLKPSMLQVLLHVLMAWRIISNGKTDCPSTKWYDLKPLCCNAFTLLKCPWVRSWILVILYVYCKNLTKWK